MKLILKLIFIITATANFTRAEAQSWQWASKAGGIENDYVDGIDVDQFGNTFATGTFYDSISFGTAGLVNHGTWSVYLAKYDGNGNLVWAKIAASDSLISVSGIDVSASGKISITGQYDGSAFFGDTQADTLFSLGSYDVFVSQYDGNGNLIWAQSTGGAGIDYSGGICSDAGENIFITGDIHLTAFPFSGAKIFLAMYDSTGNNKWLRTELNNGNGHYGNGIRAGTDGNVCITGEFFNQVLFDSTLIIDAGNIEANSFSIKFDTSGNILWGQKAGSSSGYCGSNNIEIDANGNCYISGFYRGTISFGTQSITSGSGTVYDVFVAKYDAWGNFLWVNKSSGPCSAKNLDIDPGGIVYLTGNYSQPISFGAYSLNHAGGSDIYIATLDTGGYFIQAFSCGGPGEDYSGGIKISSGDVIIAGSFVDTIYFGTSFMLTGNGNLKSDIFISKRSQATNISDEPVESSEIIFYPNPAGDEIQLGNFQGEGQYTVYDLSGRVIKRRKILKGDAIFREDMRDGIYFIELILNDGERVINKIEFTKK